MDQIVKALREYVRQNPPADGESVLGMLYEYHNEHQPYDNEQIKEDFNALYQQMNGMPLKEIDRIIYPVCTLCRDHERSGFIEGLCFGVVLIQELDTKKSRA